MNKSTKKTRMIGAVLAAILVLTAGTAVSAMTVSAATTDAASTDRATGGEETVRVPARRTGSPRCCKPETQPAAPRYLSPEERYYPWNWTVEAHPVA